MDEYRRRTEVGTGIGELADGRAVDREQFGTGSGGAESTGVEDRVAALQLPPPCGNVGERTGHQPHAVAAEVAGPGRRADEAADLAAPVEQGVDEVSADETGGAGHECGAHEECP